MKPSHKSGDVEGRVIMKYVSIPDLYHHMEEFKIRVEERTTSLDWRRVEAVSSSFAVLLLRRNSKSA